MPKKIVAAELVRPVYPQASPTVMAAASNRANLQRVNKATAYYYGNLGDSVERRFNGSGPFLGGGSNEGMMGTGTSYQAQGYGSYYGTSIGYGPWNRYGPWSSELGGNIGPFRFMRRFSGHSSIYHSIIASCQMAYWGYGIIRNVVDLYTDFAAEGIDIVHEDITTQNFFTAWAKKVRLVERIQTILMNYFTLGNVFIHRRWASLTDEDKNKLRRNQAQLINNDLYYTENGQQSKIEAIESSQIQILKTKTLGPSEKVTAANAADDNKFEIQKNRIPWEYIMLNPLQMEIRGNKFANEHRWVIGLEKKDLQDINKQFRSVIDIGSTDINIPSELKNKLKKYNGNTNGGFVAEIELDADELAVVQDRKFDWCDWSIPFVYPSLRAVNFKDCLRNMEIRACESVINSIFLFKLGNQEAGMPAEDEHFERLADMLQQPGQALNIIWNEAISAEVITADVAKLFDPKKHESADRDILVALGVPEALLGGKGGAFANSFAGAATLLERIETARMRVTEWLLGELKIICQAMGFRTMPEIKWGKTSLRDKNAERALIIQMYDRGLLSPTYMHEEFDTTTEIEANRYKDAKPLIEDGTFKPRGPYIKPMDEANLDKKLPQPQTDPLKIKQVNPGMPGKKSPKTPNGRPAGTKEPIARGPQKNPRGPQGRASEIIENYELISEAGAGLLDSLENFLAQKLLGLDKWKTKGFRNLKQLPQEEKDRLENLTFSIFSHMKPATKFESTDDFVIALLNSGASEGIKADVLATYQRKIANYIEEFGKEPSKEHRRKFITSAWTQTALATY